MTTPQDYWREILKDSVIATNLVFGGILVTYVGFALTKVEVGDTKLLDFLGLLLMIYLFVKFTFSFPRDAYAGGLRPTFAWPLQAFCALLLIAATMYSAWPVGLNGQVIGAIQSSWVIFGTVDFIVASGGSRIGKTIDD